MTPDDVVAEARRWVGTPYRNKGRTAQGLDCLGLLVQVARAFGVPHEDRLDYSDWPDPGHAILREMDRWLARMPAAATVPGSIGVFAERALPCHCGVFTERHGAPHLVHAHLRSRRVVEEPFPHGAALRLVGLYRFPGMEA